MHHFTHAYLPAVLPRQGRATKSSSSRIMNAIRNSRKRSIALRELRALDDSTLRDIGLTRSQATSVVDSLLAQSGKTG
jgi:uncharacterized protein YjiS (DUF1127 family)